MNTLSPGRRPFPPAPSLPGDARWFWVIGALALLVLTAAFFHWTSGQLRDARQELGAAEQRLVEARQDEARTIEQAKRAQLALGLMRDAHTSGLGFAAWAERRFNIKQAGMSRGAANALLSEMLRSPDRLFGAEEFEMSVRQAGEGLFSSVNDPASTVQVSVRGSLLFRTTGSGS
ncbi:MAG: hypothetical protein AB7S86_15635 [Hydrogenophaga sp.]|uniref:hypothetical protein n=1 Tax=Hydrogenophaga sp. TaxID=1904254 RepID=UPI003D0AEC75